MFILTNSMKYGGFLMRLSIALLIILIFLTGSIVPGNRTHAIHELQRLHESLSHPADDMDWKVTIKEQIDPIKMKKIVNNDENRHLVASSSTESRVQYEMEINDVSNLDIMIQLNHYAEEQLSEVLIEINGKDWNESIANEYDNFVTKIKDMYITENARVFACLNSSYSDIINRSDLEKEVIDILRLQHVSTLTDSLTDPEKQVVLAGYSPHIKEAITIENEEINIQIVIKTNDSEQFSIMIGTPIIIDEY